LPSLDVFDLEMANFAKLGECVKVGYHNQSTYFDGATTPRPTPSPPLGILATVI
jgi:hypothetical protein